MRNVFLLGLLAGPLLLCAQVGSLGMPLNVRDAYVRGTRSPLGVPGARYWQNSARYAIDLHIDPPGRRVDGSEEIMYTNNSPDTLREIFIKLTQNIHRYGAARENDAPPEYLTDGIVIDSFSINGLATAWEDNQRQHTVQGLGLPALRPHDSIRLSFRWHYRLAAGGGREGMIDTTSFFLAYFYPRIAVYDDYYGWDWTAFNDVNEFYSDFNDYVVRITLPRSYTVWGTGTLVNEAEVLSPECLRRLRLSYRSDSVVHILTRQDSGTRRGDAGPATWTWAGSNIPDMAFGISDHFVWDASSVVADSATGRRVSIQAVYNDTAADLRQAAMYGRYTIGWLSHQWPGLAFPYPKMVAFQGYADMEYPMMVNISTNSNLYFSRFLLDHEIAHTYFPFYMGINETRYPFMDEGWATFFELLINRSEYGQEAGDAFFRDFRVADWSHDRFAEGNVPIITPANVIRNPAYGTNAYGKPALAYLALRDLLGDTLFKKCLQGFITAWHGRHPTPWDFFNFFSHAANRNLDWFWNNWFFTNGNIDLVLDSPVREKNGYRLAIRNAGGLYIPFDLKLAFTDGSQTVMHQTAACWAKSDRPVQVHIATGKTLASATIATGVFVDADEGNNRH